LLSAAAWLTNELVALGALAALHLYSIASALHTARSVTAVTWAEVYGFNCGLVLAFLAPLILIGFGGKLLVPWNVIAPVFTGNTYDLGILDSFYIAAVDVSLITGLGWARS
jgi:hypothetical protein